MASAVFDTQELDAYARELAQAARDAPKTQKKFMRKEGSKLLRRTKQEARRVKVRTGNYKKSIKRGKVYEYDGAQAVRVYSTAPHAHLIEDGHRMVSHDGRELGFVPGMHIFEVSGKDFQPEFLADIDEMLDEVVKEL